MPALLQSIVAYLLHTYVQKQRGMQEVSCQTGCAYALAASIQAASDCETFMHAGVKE